MRLNNKSGDRPPKYVSEKSVVKTKEATKTTEYDKREIFEAKIEPIINKLADICVSQRIPFFFACCTANDKNGSEYRYDGNSPEMLGIKLNDQFFDKMLLVIHGFDVETSDIAHVNDEGISSRAQSMISDLEDITDESED